VRRPTGLVVLGDDGEEGVAEWVRDEVSVHGPDPATWSQAPRLTFTEWEVEAAPGQEERSADVVHVLRALGAEPSRTASKLRTALGLDRPNDAHAPGSEAAKPPPADSMRAALSRYLVTAAESFARADQSVRLGVPDSVHQMRVQARRMRSALRTCAPVLDTAEVAGVRRTLGEAADLLGGERDVEVAAARIAAELARMCGDPTIAVADVVLSTAGLPASSPADARLDADAARTALATLRPAIARRQRQAHRELLAAMDEPWWAELHADIQRLAADPPTTPLALASATDVLPRLVGTQWHALARRARGLTPDSSSDAWHRTRLTAKRVRYAADLAAPLLGKRAREFARHLSDITELLGELQDTVLVRALLDEATDPSSPLGRPVAGSDDARAAFVLGRLYAEEADRERRLRQRFHHVWDALDRRGLTKWMKV